MNTKKIILEVAGISFEVRKWAHEIENYVKNYIAKEKEKLKTQQPKEKPKPLDYNWSYNDDFESNDEFKWGRG